MRKTIRERGFCLCLMLLFLLLPISVFANQGNYEEILKLKHKIVEIQNKGELGIRNFTLCSKIVNLGCYVPLPEPKIKQEEPILLYYEPTNIYTKTTGGRYEFWFTQDVIILDENEEILWEQENALSMHYNTETPILDMYVNNNFNLTGAPPGKYIFKVVLHDLFRDESVSEAVHFEIVE